VEDIEQQPLSDVQQFLAAVVGQAVEHVRSASQFFEVFTPSIIVDAIEGNVELRAQIVHVACDVRIEIARKSSPSAAKEYLAIALSEALVAPEVMLQVFTAEHQARYLDPFHIWSFIAEPSFLDPAQTGVDAPPAKMLAVILAEALKHRLVTPEEIVRAIDFQTFFKSVSKLETIDTFVAFADAEPGTAFDVILAKYPPIKITQNVPHQTIWRKVVLPLIARRHQMSLDSDSSDHAAGPAKPRAATPPQPTTPSASLAHGAASAEYQAPSASVQRPTASASHAADARLSAGTAGPPDTEAAAAAGERGWSDDEGQVVDPSELMKLILGDEKQPQPAVTSTDRRTNRDESPRASSQPARVYPKEEQVQAPSKSSPAPGTRPSDAVGIPRIQRVSSIPPSSVRVPRPGSASQQRYDDGPEIQVREVTASSPELDASQTPMPQPRAPRPPSTPSASPAPARGPSRPPEPPPTTFKSDK
jgi:hypothetical protein